jgi:hypothetical protein
MNLLSGLQALISHLPAAGRHPTSFQPSLDPLVLAVASQEHKPLPMVELCSCNKMPKPALRHKQLYFDWNLTKKCNQPPLCLLTNL